MRIAHVVTYISADGAFGGPVAVAMEQAAELARRGHDVEIIAGWDGEADVKVPGVKMRLFRVSRFGSGFSRTFSMGLHQYFHKHASGFDIVHVHAARDLITLPVALRALRRGVPVFLQTHGMVMPDTRVSVRLVDWLATRRLLRRARKVFVLTDVEAEGLSTVLAGTHLSTFRIANGIKPFKLRSRVNAGGPPIVLFLARLHPRKRVMSFAEAGKVLLAEGIDATFRIVGPDEGDRPELERFIAHHDFGESMIYAGAIGPGESGIEMQRAAVYVLPSFGEVFPMTVLEAMAAGTPVVLTSYCGLAPQLEALGAAVVTDGSVDALAQAIRYLLSDATNRDQVVSAAATALIGWLSIEAVVDRLEEAYEA